MTSTSSRRIIALTLSVLPLTAFAQFEPTTREALHGCAVLDTVARRLDCIDSVLADAQAGRSRASAERTDDTEAQAGTDSGVAAREVPAARATAGESAAAEAAAAEARPPAASASGAAAARQEEAAGDANGDRMIVVVDVFTRVPGEAVFTTEDGRRFVQTSGGSRLFLPEVPFDAELRSGAIGGLFLAPVEQGRTVRVTLSD